MIHLDRQQITGCPKRTIKAGTEPPEHPPFASMERRALVIVATCLPLSPHFFTRRLSAGWIFIGNSDFSSRSGGRWRPLECNQRSDIPRVSLMKLINVDERDLKDLRSIRLCRGIGCINRRGLIYRCNAARSRALWFLMRLAALIYLAADGISIIYGKIRRIYGFRWARLR